MNADRSTDRLSLKCCYSRMRACYADENVLFGVYELEKEKVHDEETLTTILLF